MPTLAPSSARLPLNLLFTLPVIVSALGFFVDVYDLLIFSIVRVPSLQSLGLSKSEVSSAGTFILNCQQAGLVLGGVLWGVLGDKRGRMAVLFSSIITYSVANIACGFIPLVTFVSPTYYYALMRFVAGIGLSGEIGIAMVLMSEILPKELRSFGTSIVAGVGYLGAGVAYFTQALFNWPTAFFIGGGMGLLLLLLRVRVFESGVFTAFKEKERAVNRGNFGQFFRDWPSFLKYTRCVAVGIPTWFVVGILATFANEFGEALGIAEPIKPGIGVVMVYVGLAAGDLLSGPLSHWLRSRRRTVIYMLMGSAGLSAIYLFGGIKTAGALYVVCGLAGFFTGYVAMYLTMIAEQYGTNLRATATTSAPSVVRGMVIPMILFFQAIKPSIGALVGAGLVGIVVYALAFWSLANIDETFANDLEFVEE